MLGKAGRADGKNRRWVPEKSIMSLRSPVLRILRSRESPQYNPIYLLHSGKLHMRWRKPMRLVLPRILPMLAVVIHLSKRRSTIIDCRYEKQKQGALPSIVPKPQGTKEKAQQRSGNGEDASGKTTRRPEDDKACAGT